MRHDMYKVIVERPRHGRYGVRGELRCRDFEESPRQASLSAYRRTKSLNENLRPLERFLQAQVDRPWNKVYAELCAGIDRRNTVQQHILQHVEDFVAVRVVSIDGQLGWIRSWGAPQPLQQRWAPRLFVDPASGVLLRNRLQERSVRARRAEQAAIRQPDPSRRVIGPARQLHCIDGVWFEIDLAPVAEAAAFQERPFDVLRRLDPARCPARQSAKGVAANQALFGRSDVYAWRKRQLGRDELRRHGLSNRAS